MRSYGEYCALAHALDVVGERWTLLIVREMLILGPCRYTDLQNGLPGIASNLLAERLHDMEEAGLVRREAAPPPFNVTLFHLTERGEALRPAIEALAAWGGPLIARPIRDDEAFLSHWLKLPFEYHLKDRSPEAGPITLEVRTGDEPMLIEAANGVVQARRGHAEKPDAIITGTGSVILGLLTGRLDLAEARRRGLKVEGSENAVLRVRGERPAQ